MELKYIMPDWDDYVDADFDFEKDKFSTKTRTGRREIYLHEIMGDNAPCDGILVSLAQINHNKGALKNFIIDSDQPKKIREIMRIQENLKIVGDCGAFTYKDEEIPPITPEQAADLYESLGFDIGASVDHMIFGEKSIIDEKGNTVKIPISIEDQKNRVKITRENAKKFINIVKSKKYNFTPMGTIQGITIEDYADAFKYYVKLGYEYVALGSLVPKTDEEIKAVILAVGAEYNKLSTRKKNKIKIHLFGVLRPKLYKFFNKNGIRSFDSISFFRKAWLRSNNNYLDANGEWYAALRVPQATLPTNVKKLVKKGLNIEDVQKLEKKVLKSLLKYDKGDTNIKKVLKLLLEYDELFDRIFENGDKIREAYARTLKDRPWEKCNCQICKEIGIHVLIFRGANRNKRRGFHNTIIFNNNLKQYNFESDIEN